MPSALVRRQRRRAGGWLPGHELDEELRRLFRHRLLAAMTSENMDFATLARMTTIPVRTLYSYKNGHLPRLGSPRREALAVALGVSVAWLFGSERSGGDPHAGAENK